MASRLQTPGLHPEDPSVETLQLLCIEAFNRLQELKESLTDLEDEIVLAAEPELRVREYITRVLWVRDALSNVLLYLQ